MRLSSILILVAISLTSSVVSADQWPSWRGPENTGVAPAGDYPVAWNADDVAWKFELPGKGASTPVIWNDKIFVTSAMDGDNGLLCLNRQGELLWEKTVGEQRKGKHKKATGSNSSPVTDGERVYVYFKSGDLACFDFDGKQIWHHNLQEKFGKDTLWWDLGTSAVLTKENLVVACMQSDNENLENSYLAAFDRTSGELSWKQDRNMRAPNEANQSYSTPQVVEFEGVETIVVLGADHITAHAAKDGSELWRVGDMNPKQDQYFRSISSPVVSDGIVVAPYARGNSLTAIRLGGQGDVTDSHVIWSIEEPSSDVPTPVVKDGQVIVLTDKGIVAGLDLSTGKMRWELKLEKSRDGFSASPILVGDHVYATREDGTTFVVNTSGGQPQIVSKNTVDEFTVATPVFSDGQILIRTNQNLYCFQKSS